ncbi:unnamed protein product [Blepharisma stoltei]|uniref:Peptidase A1 domain-containing protein n=1 Tax=Blepharisma stoltei TaxID=1481888 RepID=A0AAU9JTS9_9CILI|nr:unnamed protein product [Blepharisma stoltei]
MSVSRFLMLLVAVSFAYFKIPLKKLNKEALVNSTSTDLPTTQSMSSSLLYNYYNLQYIADIYVGSSLKWFSVLVSTTSPHLWIPSTSCIYCHASFSYFDPSTSSTYKYIGSNYKASYSFGYAKGDLSSDIFGIGDDTFIYVYDQKFILAHEDSGFDAAYFDGVLGLEYGYLSFGYPTFLDKLKAQGQISRKLFSVYLNDNYFLGSSYDGSAITFGGYDLAAYSSSSSVKYVYLDKNNGKWQLKLSKLYVEGWSISSGTFTANFDVGNGLIVAPPTEFYNITSDIALYGDCWWSGGFLNCDCGFSYSIYDYPIISFKLGSYYTFGLNPWDYFYQADSTTCILLFGMGTDSITWNLGDPFFRKYYTIFDADYAMIGFADALRYSTTALAANTSSINKIKTVDREALIQKEKSDQSGAENSTSIYYWAISGILLACLSGFIYLSYKIKRASDQGIPYHKISA